MDKDSQCNHIWIYAEKRKHWDDKVNEEYSVVHCGCIKCGMKEDKIDHHIRPLNIHCNLELGMALYGFIRDKYPKAKEEYIIESFKESLTYIRKNVYKKIERNDITKKLSLKPNFNKWFAEDI